MALVPTTDTLEFIYRYQKKIRIKEKLIDLGESSKNHLFEVSGWFNGNATDISL
jgi:hypothetical protein